MNIPFVSFTMVLYYLNKQKEKDENVCFEMVMNTALKDYYGIDYNPDWTHFPHIPGFRHCFIPEYKYSDEQVKQIEQASYDEYTFTIFVEKLKPKVKFD